MEPTPGFRPPGRSGALIGWSADSGAAPVVNGIAWCSIADHQELLASWVDRPATPVERGPVRPIGHSMRSAPAFPCDLCDSLWPSPESLHGHKRAEHPVTASRPVGGSG